jgi:hypothetical protein
VTPVAGRQARQPLSPLASVPVGPPPMLLKFIGILNVLDRADRGADGREERFYGREGETIEAATASSASVWNRSRWRGPTDRATR